MVGTLAIGTAGCRAVVGAGSPDGWQSRGRPRPGSAWYIAVRSQAVCTTSAADKVRCETRPQGQGGYLGFPSIGTCFQVRPETAASMVEAVTP
jgi:hypothetical protein